MYEIELNNEQKALIVEAETIAVQYEEVKITKNEEYAKAGEDLKIIAGNIKKLEELRMFITRPIDQLKKNWIEKFSKPIDKLKTADSVLRRAMQTFFTEKEAERKREEAKLKELADKEAAKLEARAEKAEDKGQEAKAEQLREQAQMVAATTPLVASKVEKVEGVSMRETWNAEVFDLLLLVKAIAENKASLALIEPNMTEIRKRVRALKNDFKIDGIRVFSEQSTVVKA